jgi:exodeoxyribonuclease V alpha subunit
MTSEHEKITLAGHLERITFYNEDNHYTIARFITDPDHSRVTVVGYLCGVSTGQDLKIQGAWGSHPKYGQQFKIDSFEVILPSSAEGIRKYLESGIIKGIGKKMAASLVRQFEEDTLEVIEKRPERLREISGIGTVKAETIKEAWRSHHMVRGLAQFLQNHGVNISYSAKILKAYKEDAVETIKSNPFCLVTDIPGVQFSVVDTIARSMGTAKEDPKRVAACIGHLLEQSASRGHTFCPQVELLLNCLKQFDIQETATMAVLGSMAESGDLVVELVAGDPDLVGIYPQELHKAETAISHRVMALLSMPAPIASMDPLQITDEVLKKLAIQPSPEQLDVLMETLSLRMAIITGGPGTGKTTLIRSITAIQESSRNCVILAAPTGRAARRISEVTGKKAATIHKLLGYNLASEQFEKNENDPLEADTVIIDEASMVDTLLMHHLLKAIPMTARIILVGDISQLPSVGPGNVLSDMIDSGCIATFELTEIFRQSQESPIVINAHKVRTGELPEIEKKDDADVLSEFYFIEQASPGTVVNTIVELCNSRIPQRFGLDSTRDIQVLTPMHRGDVGTINLNKVLQEILNPKPVSGDTATRFRIKDKVMHLKNNYQKEVFNGDIGTVCTLEPSIRELSVDYGDRVVKYDFDELDELTLAYAISVHKSQGSEYPAVVVPLLTQHYPLLQRNLLYTAITRGKELVIIVGTKKALETALKNDRPGHRKTGLKDRLSGLV